MYPKVYSWEAILGKKIVDAQELRDGTIGLYFDDYMVEFESVDIVQQVLVTTYDPEDPDRERPIDDLRQLIGRSIDRAVVPYMVSGYPGGDACILLQFDGPPPLVLRSELRHVPVRFT